MPVELKTLTIGIIGNGVVGQATGKAFSECGVGVLSYDTCRERNDPGMTLKDLATYSDVIIICLPTPSLMGGRLNVSILADTIYQLNQLRLHSIVPVIVRSTIPVGWLEETQKSVPFPLYHWPEFLTARSARYDSLNPPILVIGVPSIEADYGFITQILCQRWPHVFILVTHSDESALIKLGANALGALLVAGWNELACIADKHNISFSTVRRQILRLGRLPSDYSQVPGPDGKRGFGGTCFPKDLLEVGMMTPLAEDESVFKAAWKLNQEVREKE